MNYGFVPLTDEDKERLAPVADAIAREPKIEHTYIRLYEYTLSLCPMYVEKLNGKRYFEISCGHLGGLEWMTRTHPQFASVKGLDLQPSIVDHPQVLIGNAQDMHMVKDNSVDIIMNVEASHSYNDEAIFFKECYRILAPGGYMCWTDFRPHPFYDKRVFDKAKEARLQLITRVDITANILASLDIQTLRVQQQIQSRWYTRIMAPMWYNFHGVPGYGVYRDLQNDRWKYLAACWHKPPGNL